VQFSGEGLGGDFLPPKEGALPAYTPPLYVVMVMRPTGDYTLNKVLATDPISTADSQLNSEVSWRCFRSSKVRVQNQQHSACRRMDDTAAGLPLRSLGSFDCDVRHGAVSDSPDVWITIDAELLSKPQP
jgi:hypothetical protein